MAAHQDEGVSSASEPYPLHCAWASQLTGSRSIWGSDSSTGNVPSTGVSIPDIPLDSTPLLGHSLASLTIPLKGKWDHSLSDSPNHLCIKRTRITSPEVKVRSEYSSTQGDNHMPDPTPETRTDSEQQWWQSPSPSSSPTRGLAYPSDGVAAGSPKSTGDQVSSDSGSSRGSSVDSNLDTATWDCLSCSDTDEISVRTAREKYGKRVRASCMSSKGIVLDECTWMKRNGGQPSRHVGLHDHEIVWAWAEACSSRWPVISFEMRRSGHKDWLIDPYSQSYWFHNLHHRESDGGRLRDRWRPWSCPWNSSILITTGSTRRGQSKAMVDLQGLHSSDMPSSAWMCQLVWA